MAAIAPVFDGGSAGSGGAGEGGQGSGNPSGSEQPVGLTEAQEKQVNEILNKALGPRIKRLEESQAKALTDFGTKLTESITSTLAETLSKLETDDGKGGKPKPNATDLSQNPEFRALKKQNEDIAKQLEAEREEKKAAKAAARSETLNRKVESELTALGIADPKSARLILQGEGLVNYEDDDGDAVVFKDEDGGALPLKKGLESWAKSAVGKRFMPATGAAGSGERPRGGREGSGGTGKSGSQGLTDAAVGESIASHFGIGLTG